ncbi:Extracellular exo-alpha-(1-_5)-L-arabinofuranosidase [Paenibacillus allorhizoplanae]|uniref:Extracellular exo-alpha-(1->5)-L-arabinofuranosidase n=1 Tax=Paenibacillus allorhizoplanae TaxID=2905648 RepID=A0ABM9CCA5_9BACL|nr:family 43 glycosylhydrolase [Paenibacillus allorhizoplanae]CAH1208013.1 Extracellular exo-alpha-(1->5)-L-arabinofuranosidase [Paenibacillus allorhizoplanae]
MNNNLEKSTISEVFMNPLVEQRADPWVYKHTDGYYYFTASVPEFDRIELRRARRIQELNASDVAVAWTKHKEGPMSSHIWAPEIHFIHGKWYIYFAAARSGDTDNGMFDHRMFVLENDSSNPLEGTWIEKGQIVTKWDSFSLDATTFEHRDIRYLVWAQKDPAIAGNSNLYMSAMANPWTLQGEQVMLSKPEFAWETIGFLVNEGPAVIRKNGRIFISYSASATDYNYCMGLLSADENSDLLDPASWTKAGHAVFQTNDETGQYGPGHNCFTVSEDETEDIFIYHARNYKEINGDPLYDPNRHARAQVLKWSHDGAPLFGIPVRDSKDDTVQI